MSSKDRAFRARNHAPSSSQPGRAETGDKKDGLEMNHSTRSGCPAKSRDSLGNMHRAAGFEICQRQPVSEACEMQFASFRFQNGKMLHGELEKDGVFIR